MVKVRLNHNKITPPQMAPIKATVAAPAVEKIDTEAEERARMIREADERVERARLRREELAKPRRNRIIIHTERPVLNDSAVAENLRLQRNQQRRAQSELDKDEEGFHNPSHPGIPSGGISPELDSVD
jgi:hypothetical protein